MSIKDKLAAAAGNAKEFVESGKLREGFDKTVAPCANMYRAAGCTTMPAELSKAPRNS